ncbi:ATP-dependent DNA helicase RecG [Pseudonocardia sp. KRD-184]|uniref:ATP-dependent DNA helicase RecG n=1 Tax=Pseudonocardia oceani TaxID=2792013 RepID=A0ABS6UDR0_9PSEU|nr:ATP-dependent DNA helicase RecG [Pseudonocardia oceani]MBW0088888.1 ATP-dependent DNA helicase RecG [Pseudonocardia oceani]MBW0095807.1 ATP-dependent DNA helicase RecG [Pseudonocardia oceani]MBW0108969.1 ATP-dependent DNA helicase RecG [Pseudonocardia oceani]MBW0122169.1 ATP-dependent DNA helicase RecG [Pseudonocardia oceani]MBW0130371.1 ATP-dependent DNA helicase RecG [Pseudonocardia oceani]
MNVDLDAALEPLLGRKSADLLAAQLEIRTVGELVRHYPRRYVDRGKLTDIAGLEIGEHATLVAQVASSTLRDMRARRGKLLAVVIRDEKGAQLDCTFFNGHKVQHLIHPGVRAVFSGKVGVFNGKLQLTHPQFEPIDETDEVRPFLSVYPATGKIASQVIAKCVRIVLDLLDAGGRVEVTDPLPPKIRERESLPELGRALRRIHVPETEADIHAARHRLVWDEALGVQLALALRRQATAARPAPECPPVAGGLLDAFDARLPFTLTAGQQEVGAQVAADLARAHPMNRLVQGDVGAGKTIIALRAMLQAVDNGQQAAMLAPTEVLAAQHARSLRAMLGPLAQAGELGGDERATSVTLLTGSLGAKAKRQALLDAQSGRAGIVVGTHALIQDRVGFADLGLVVVDEQHRFGVEQRDALRGRGEKAPHMLVMTATPIPRTVAMTVYGDLTVSSLRELPRGRSPIATSVVPLAEKPQWFASVWRRIHDEVGKGHQAYVVFPRVGDAEKDADADVEPPGPDEEARRPPLAVLDIAPRLQEGALAGLRLAILHGKLPADEKDAVMRSFERGEIDVLLATTVIEVGVDVPNATAIVILDAERFGLSQLHQLRGRVGRGAAPGVCLLVTDMPEATAARERLAAVEGTTDGFELARLDLELRREGDVLGALQSGRRSGLRLLSLLKHEDVIAKAQVYAADLVAHDPGLATSPGLAALVGEVVTDDRAEYLDKV